MSSHYLKISHAGDILFFNSLVNRNTFLSENDYFGAVYYRLPLQLLFTFRLLVYLLKILLSCERTLLSYCIFVLTSFFHIIHEPICFIILFCLFNSYMLTSYRFVRSYLHLYVVSYIFQLVTTTLIHSICSVSFLIQFQYKC